VLCWGVGEYLDEDEWEVLEFLLIVVERQDKE
jgi:hypothetical protein